MTFFEASSLFRLFLEHDVFRKPVPTFRHHALTKDTCSMRVVTVAAAQMGPIQKAEGRQQVVARMLELMRGAKAKGCDLIVYPELALTTFFPRWYMTDWAEVDTWFEREMPNAATRPLFDEARKLSMAMSFGYAELTPDGHRFNTSILTDKSGRIVG